MTLLYSPDSSPARNDEQREHASNSDLRAEVEARAHKLESGVKEASRVLSLAGHVTRFPDIPHLEGDDAGLYPRFVQFARKLGCTVVDDDAITRKFLPGNSQGVSKNYLWGPEIMVKHGSPRQMSATLAHEIGHQFDRSSRVQDEEIVAEGAAFITCDYYNIDTSPQAFPYIAAYNRGVFTNETLEGIKFVSQSIIEGVLAQA